MPSNKRKKRHFLLIEILLAIALISMLSIPLITNPIYFYKSEIKTLEKMELERVADLTFLEIKLKLYKNEIPLNEIKQTLKSAEELFLDSSKKPYTIDICNNKKKIVRSYKIASSYQKKSLDSATYKNTNIQIFLKPKDLKKPYSYKYKTIIKVQ